jgi:uncharacterized RDD family membrane protein YckC
MATSAYVLEKKLLTSDRDRFFNGVIDFVFISVFIFVFSFFIVIIGNVFQWDIYSAWVEIMISLGVVGTYVSFAMIYYMFLEGLFGRTIGKIVTGSVVVDENGLKPGFKIIFVRTLYRLIPFEALSFLSKSTRFWHDSFSKTYVVEKKDLEQDMENFYSLELIGKKEVI